MQVVAHDKAGLRREYRDILRRPIAGELGDSPREHELAEIRTQVHVSVGAGPVANLHGAVEQEPADDRRIPRRDNADQIQLARQKPLTASSGPSRALVGQGRAHRPCHFVGLPGPAAGPAERTRARLGPAARQSLRPHTREDPERLVEQRASDASSGASARSWCRPGRTTLTSPCDLRSRSMFSTDPLVASNSSRTFCRLRISLISSQRRVGAALGTGRHHHGTRRHRRGEQKGQRRDEQRDAGGDPQPLRQAEVRRPLRVRTSRDSYVERATSHCHFKRCRTPAGRTMLRWTAVIVYHVFFLSLSVISSSCLLSCRTTPRRIETC